MVIESKETASLFIVFLCMFRLSSQVLAALDFHALLAHGPRVSFFSEVSTIRKFVL